MLAEKTLMKHRLSTRSTTVTHADTSSNSGERITYVSRNSITVYAMTNSTMITLPRLVHTLEGQWSGNDAGGRPCTLSEHYRHRARTSVADGHRLWHF